MSSSNWFVRLLRGTWRFFDGFRRVMHLLLMVLVFLGVLAILPKAPTPLPAKAALLVAPKGPLVEQLAGDPLTRSLDEVSGRAEPQTLVRDLVDAIEGATTDDRIQALYLDLSGMGGAGLPKLERVARAIDAFRAQGKTVVASADFYTQNQYYLAARADEVYLHPSGFVFLQGYGRYRMYYASALEKLLVDWNVFKVGEFKSFVEPFLRDDMSPEDKATSRIWLSQLWQRYVSAVADARSLEAEALRAYVTGFADDLVANDGDLARQAQQAGLVDELWHRDQVRERLIELVGEDDKHGYRHVDFHDYVTRLRATDFDSGPAVGVIVAAGEILDGKQPPGTIGGDSLAKLIRQARHDDDVRAVVLQVDSPGGSKFASEVVLRELQQLKAAGKPLVVSMSSVAASGGYWISMDADEIWASPVTITGSIGIGAYFPTVDRTMDAVGVHTDGVGTTPWAGQFRPDRPMSDAARSILQANIEHGYRQFVSEVGRAREMSYEAVDQVARGRVWSGEDAHRLGLVDRLGDIDEAIASAATLAGLDDDSSVRYLEDTMGFRESLALMFAGKAQDLAGYAAAPRSAFGTGINAWAMQVKADLERLARFNDPGNLYYWCFCVPE